MTRLSFVPTPIGHLGDMTLRALDVLRSVDLIAAEDTRHSRKLLEHYQIDRPLARLDAHTIVSRAPGLLEAHAHIAYITDAGTPGISDPGADLLKLALERGDSVEVLPGATAFVPALVLSGLPLARFYFEGFLPRKGSARQERLEHIAKRDTTTVLYESPRRLLKTLGELADACGPDRQASVSRELSKRFETTYRGSLQMLQDDLAKGVKGEVVITIGPALAEDKAEQDFHNIAQRLYARGLSARDIRDSLVDLGLTKNAAYKLSLDVTKASSL